MIKQEIYNKINNTLNSVFTNIRFQHEKIVLGYDKYLFTILKLSDYSLGILEDDFDIYNFSTDINRKRYVSIEDTINICREIIASIDSTCGTSYLDEFNEMIYKAVDIELHDYTLDNQRITWNHCGYTCDYLEDEESNIRDKQIDIHFYGCFDDVRDLIHEFFHYINIPDKSYISRTMLTEAVSIYFETYAVKYMIEHGICNTSEVDTTFRIRDFLSNASNFNKIGLNLFYFTTIGALSDDSYDFLFNNFVGFDREKFEEDIMVLNSYISSFEDKYEDGNPLNDSSMEEFVIDGIRNDFKLLNYLIGTLITAHMFDKGNIHQMVHMNELIKRGVSLEEIFNELGIDIQELKEECEEVYVDADANNREHPLIESALNSFGLLAEELIGYAYVDTKKTTR